MPDENGNITIADVEEVYNPRVTPVGVLERLTKLSPIRSEKWHNGGEPWTIADWTLAMCGEAGEAANFAKKIRRQQSGARHDGDLSMEELHIAYGKELADTVIYAQLCAEHIGIDLGEAIVNKFNETSVRMNFQEKL